MVCNDVFHKIEQLKQSYLSVWEDVCNIESPTDHKSGVDAVGKYFINLAREHHWGIEVLEQAVSGNVVCITANPDQHEPPISLSGHIDTVHPCGSFGTPAVTRDSERIYGPGVLDCKGGAVAAFLAMDALIQCGFAKRPIQLLLQTDEEKNSIPSAHATIQYICQKAQSSVAFLNCEPHWNNSLALIRKGILQYKFTVHGKSAHSSSCDTAANAIAEAAHKLLKLEQLKDSQGITCNCGPIHGGTTPNTVADTCEFYADIRFSTLEEADTARQYVQTVAKETTVPGCSCIAEQVSYRPSMEESPKNQQLLLKMNAIYSENGLPILTAQKRNGGSDAAYITQCGIPCVDSMGVEGGNLHTTAEFAFIDSLASSAKRIAAVIYGM